MPKTTVISPTTIFNALQGRWTLTRKIDGFGKMQGIANFVPVEPDRLHYHEDVQVTWEDGKAYEAFRDYYYRLRDNEIEVDFQDGRLFHKLEFVTGMAWPREAKGGHLCINDFYQGLYRFESPDRFSIVMTVQGPQKNHCIETQFERLTP